MRLHELEIAAFGPFVRRVRIDVDDLSAQGLFLLSGPTGAGKTSVLDAVCFALYGEVPGDRAGARRLRSDQAPPDAVPEVRLVTTLAGRRLEITRSPAWERPKKRGPGLTPQHATVRVREHVAGDWSVVTTRHDEAGLLVSGLLGMNQAQFTQVAMLPQGRFQAFLRAGADERQKLLQQLFGTARFERVEAWLKERRTAVRREVEAAHRDVAEVVNRTSEVADEPLPEWDCDDLSEPARAGELASWADALAGDLDAACRSVEARTEGVERTEAAARDRAELARARAERHRRLEVAHAEHADLEAHAAEHAGAERDLEAALRARAVRPLQTLAVAAARSRDDASTRAGAAVTEAAHALGLTHEEVVELEEPAWAALAEQEAAAAHEAGALVPLARRQARLEAELATHRQRLPVLREQREELARRLEAAPALLEDLRARHDEARHAATAAVGLRDAVAALAARRAARVRVARLEGDLLSAREAHRDAREHALSCRGRVLDLREARLAGMAGEIAHALLVGASCPVCGSAEHPAKATLASAGPDRDAETAAQRAADDASATEHLRDQEVRTLETELATAAARAGDEDTVALAARHGETERALAAAEALAGLVAARAADLVEAEGAQRAESARYASLSSELARLETTLESVEQEAVETAARLAEHVAAEAAGPSGLIDLLEARREQRTVRAEAAARAGRLVAQAVQAREQLATLTMRLDAAVAEAGFTDLATALEAVLDEDALTSLGHAVRRHQQRLAAVQALLADLTAQDEVDARDEDGPTDPEVAEAEHRDALAVLHEHHARLVDLRRRSARLTDLAAHVREAVTAWLPRDAELALVAGLSSFVEGRGADNLLQMRLSAYVLAFRLGQVVAAANVRLAGMSDQRYSLEHTAARGRDRRGGLGLEIRDDWSGEARPPATLSGGETFVVSLALALGLSDVVTAEAGGAELDTLFVDEGFGSLDPETLDDVMDTLDALRDGGRVVGVVSHVAEMRERIPTQLVVTKARTGSTLSVRR